MSGLSAPGHIGVEVGGPVGNSLARHSHWTQPTRAQLTTWPTVPRDIAPDRDNPLCATDFAMRIDLCLRRCLPLYHTTIARNYLAMCTNKTQNISRNKLLTPTTPTDEETI